MSNGNDNNGWRERMDKMEERHMALSQTVEIITGMQLANEQRIKDLVEAQRKNEVLMAQSLEAINSLARIAQSHEKRIEDLEQ